VPVYTASLDRELIPKDISCRVLEMPATACLAPGKARPRNPFVVPVSISSYETSQSLGAPWTNHR